MQILKENLCKDSKLKILSFFEKLRFSNTIRYIEDMTYPKHLNV